jgi:SulP family sulfate permease
VMRFMRGNSGDFFGAFADSAILLPVVSLLSTRAGFSLPALLVSTGALYLVSGWLFRAPMPVQPLKSIALSALALGAAAGEIRSATLLLGAGFLLLALFGRELLQLPEEVIRCVQWGLGLLLILQGLGSWKESPLDAGITCALASLLLFLSRISRVPWLGIFSFLVFLASLRFTHDHGFPSLAHFPANEPFRWPMVASLLLPQLALTSANSILGTELAFREYFPKRDNTLLRPRLLFSIGIGNLLMSVLGGLPFCHGSGGLTAHIRAGARSARMNAVIGSTLIGLGLLQSTAPSLGPLPGIPASAILLSVGILHLGLARGLFESNSGCAMLFLATFVTLGTRNLLYTLFATILFSVFLRPGSNPSAKRVLGSLFKKQTKREAR